LIDSYQCPRARICERRREKTLEDILRLQQGDFTDGQYVAKVKALAIECLLEHRSILITNFINGLNKETPKYLLKDHRQKMADKNDISELINKLEDIADIEYEPIDYSRVTSSSTQDKRERRPRDQPREQSRPHQQPGASVPRMPMSTQRMDELAS
jgi:hypothetical protein